jgi:hypothetical protein
MTPELVDKADCHRLKPDRHPTIRLERVAPMEHTGAGYAHAQNPKPADVTRTPERTASRRRQRRERAQINSRHSFLSFVARYCATQVVTSICMAPGHTQQVSRRDGAHHQDHARTECFVMASPEDGSKLLKPHRPRLSVDGRKHAHCSRRIRFIRFDRHMTSPPTTRHGFAITRWQLVRVRTCGPADGAVCATTQAAARLSSCFLGIPAGPWQSWCVRVRSGQWCRCAMTWPLVAALDDPRR